MLRIELQPTLIDVPGKPLGRHRLLNWQDHARQLAPLRKTGIKSAFYEPTNYDALTQPNGSCTGNAWEQCLACAPFSHPATETEALRIYSRATEIDPFPGAYPPIDTGSTGYAAAQACVEFGLIRGFGMTDSVTEIIEALQTRPGVFGCDWYDGCDGPAENGFVAPVGSIRGGHETAIVGCDHQLRRIWLRNSWGPWGFTRSCGTGYFWLSYRDVQLLLASGADAIFPDLS